MSVNLRCPVGDWTYNPSAPCVMARRPGHVFPLIWNAGLGIIEARGPDAPNPSAAALAVHVLQDHPDGEMARAVGEWETYEPLRALNSVMTRLAARPWKIKR